VSRWPSADSAQLLGHDLGHGSGAAILGGRDPL
jgi:hypothetical protein